MLHDLLPAAATALPGPDWLRERRQRAAAELADASLPTTEPEIWRYSRVEELDLARYRPIDGSTPPPDLTGKQRRDALMAVRPALLDAAGTVVVRDGVVVAVDLIEELAKRGVRLGPAADLDDALGAELVGSVAEPLDVFGLMNEAGATAPIVIDVPAGVTVDRPLVVVDWIDTDGLATFPRLTVRAGADSDVTVVEWHGSAPTVSSFASPVTELDVARAGRLRHVVVQARGERTWQIASQVTRVAQEATFLGYQAGLGGDYARSRTDCRLAGRGATGNLSAVYFGEGDQMLDFRTFQDHQAPDTSSNLLFKGAVGGKSRSVYTGLIRVEKDARGTNAFQTNRNLKLSEHAWAESVPNLEIENNDVHCSHASTVGPVDEEQRFYLESRGVPTQVAERLIVAGFFDEVIAEVPAPGVVTELRRLVQERLDQEGL
jgi:Fe-S cluster assembly protein SufD